MSSIWGLIFLCPPSCCVQRGFKRILIIDRDVHHGNGKDAHLPQIHIYTKK
jgi:hypothetical protein